jgi:hypothetical protein
MTHNTNTIQNALFIVGSPKARHSTSEVLGMHVVDALTQAGIHTETIIAHHALRTSASTASFLACYDQADVVLIAYPLYVDSLPYPLTQLMETMRDHRAQQPIAHTQRLACIGNCGFPEASHLDISVGMCQAFAQETDMAWYGALAIGEGGAISGQALSAIQGRLRHQMAALGMMSQALIADQPIPQEAIELAARPIIPHRMYTLMGTVGWHWQSHAHGVHQDLYAQPFPPKL